MDLTLLEPVLQAYKMQGRSGLLPALIAAQRIFGFLPEPVTASIAQALRVPLADVHGVVTFYTMLYNKPVGKTIVRVCTDPACAMRGADDVLHAACAQAHVSAPGATSADGNYTVERAPCLGLCADAVAVNVARQGEADAAFVGVGVGLEQLNEVFEKRGARAPNFVGGDVRVLSALCGRGAAASLRDYEAAGGMVAWRMVVAGVGGWEPGRVIGTVKAAGLVGRGGAAFPTGAKWEACANAQGAPKYVVVNGDESEPGTFKDRVLMEDDPQRVLEGALLAAYAIRAHQIYVYIRGEYALAQQRVHDAIDELRAAGLIGQNILGSGFDVDIELRSGAGAYVCGEETALLESIEGKRGLPRVKPPFPVTHGLFGKPTVINNVETLAAVPYIIAQGAAAYRSFGTEKSPGPKLFCVSGDVAQAGVYEVAFGTPLRRLLELAGEVQGELQAILFGGAAGAFATEKDLDVRLSFEDLRAAGLPLGSGVVQVFNHTRDLGDVLRRLGVFFAHESCGKCYPCQLGAHRQAEILARVAQGAARPGDAALLDDVGWTMSDASLCGLGQTAASAVRSAMRLWPGMFSPPRR